MSNLLGKSGYRDGQNAGYYEFYERWQKADAHYRFVVNMESIKQARTQSLKPLV